MTTWLPLLSALVGAFAGVAASVIAFRIHREKLVAEMAFQQRKFEEEIKTQRSKLAAEYAVQTSIEAALLQLLSLEDLRYRSFAMIRHQIGGFESNELRRHLVRTGAVRFMAADGTEMWALTKRVPEEFQLGHWRLRTAPLNKTPDAQLFPAALGDPTQY